MITPNEIKELCLRWWRDLLVATMEGRAFFPREIGRIGKVRSKDILSNLAAYRQGIETLQRHSKSQRKWGYDLVLTEQQFDKIGRQWVPEKVVIPSLEDYLQITEKTDEYLVFQQNYALVMQQIPLLRPWLLEQPVRLIEHRTWADTLKVCRYFLKNPQPDVYIRQLPIDVHTKYIEENQSIIQSLLNYIIPDELVETEKRFEPRFHLRYDQPLVRFRFLDAGISPFPAFMTDVSLPVSEFRQLNITGCRWVLVAENKMNFLTLPLLPQSIALWSGGGFNVSLLKDAKWLKNKQILYWGDLDAQGFLILHQFRSYFPNTFSVLMDEATLARFSPRTGKPAPQQSLPLLNAEEMKMYNYLNSNNLRLEQEQISQEYADEVLRAVVVGG